MVEIAFEELVAKKFYDTFCPDKHKLLILEYIQFPRLFILSIPHFLFLIYSILNFLFVMDFLFLFVSIFIVVENIMITMEIAPVKDQHP